MQKVSNPVPRIRHPDWLHRRVAALDDKFHQHKVTDFFRLKSNDDEESQMHTQMDSMDIEDFSTQVTATGRPRIAVVNRKYKRKPSLDREAEEDVPKHTGVNYKMNYSAWLKAIRPKWRRNTSSRAL